MKNILSKSGHSGDMLIGYRGFCEKCGVERRVYFAQASQQMRAKMLKGLRTGKLNYHGACEACLLCGLRDSVRNWDMMTRVQVDKDLAILEKLNRLDYQKAEDDAKENLKNDKWLEDNEKHVESYKAFRKKHNPMMS